MYCDFPVLGRCCFCMPLRRGILTFGYISLVLNVLMVVVFSFTIHYPHDPAMTIFRGTHSLPGELGIALHCIDLVFNAILIYGAHKVLKLPLVMYYYYSISTIFASLLLQVVDIILLSDYPYVVPLKVEGLPLLITTLLIEVYLIILVRSLLRKMELQSGSQVYENQLQQFVYDGRIAPNGVYNDSTVLPAPINNV